MFSFRSRVPFVADFDYATIHGDPMGGCSESSEDEESVPVTFFRN
jgi:hypothetical protein